MHISRSFKSFRDERRRQRGDCICGTQQRAVAEQGSAGQLGLYLLLSPRFSPPQVTDDNTEPAQHCTSTLNRVQIYDANKVRILPASCSRWNGTCAQTLNKRRVFLRVIEKGFCLIFTEVSAPCESSFNLLEVRVRKGVRWTDNHALHQTGTNRKTKCKLRQLRESWKAELKKVEIGT